jgi:PhnB protein
MAIQRTGIPDGFHSLTPYLVVPDAERAVGFYAQAFGAVEFHRSIDPEGVVRNVQLRIGDSAFMFSIRPDSEGVDEGKIGDMPRVSIYLYVDDADRVYQQAVAAGATSLYAPEDQPYGNREGGVTDPFGVTWWIATALEE